MQTKLDRTLAGIRSLPLSPQARRTLRGQAFAGDIAGAERGLQKLMAAYCLRYKITIRRCEECGQFFNTPHGQGYKIYKCPDCGERWRSYGA